MIPYYQVSKLEKEKGSITIKLAGEFFSVFNSTDSIKKVRIVKSKVPYYDCKKKCSWSVPFPYIKILNKRKLKQSRN